MACTSGRVSDEISSGSSRPEGLPVMLRGLFMAGLAGW